MYGTVHKQTFEDGTETSAFDVIAIAGSAGGIDALVKLLAVLPANFPAAIFVVQHLPSTASYRSTLDKVLARHTRLRVKWAEDGECLQPGTVFIAPQDRHLIVGLDGALQLTDHSKVNRVRPAADPLFASIAARFGARGIGVVLSGTLRDGAEGARAIARAGGRILTQDRITSQFFDMPRATLALSDVDFMFDPSVIAHALIALVMVFGAADWLRVSHAARHKAIPGMATPN